MVGWVGLLGGKQKKSANKSLLPTTPKLTFDGVIERACHHPLPVGVEVQRHNLRRVPQEGVQTFARLHIEYPAKKLNRPGTLEDRIATKTLGTSSAHETFVHR